MKSEDKVKSDEFKKEYYTNTIKVCGNQASTYQTFKGIQMMIVGHQIDEVTKYAVWMRPLGSVS